MTRLGSITSERGDSKMTQSAYIDVRGPHPVYVKGMTAILLEGHARTITVEVAEDLIAHGQLRVR
jgi:hypothetical protein